MDLWSVVINIGRSTNFKLQQILPQWQIQIQIKIQEKNPKLRLLSSL